MKRTASIHSLKWKLGLALIFSAAIALILMSIFIFWNTTRQFESYVDRASRGHSEEIAVSIARMYSMDKDWSRVQEGVRFIPVGRDKRLLVADTSGLIVVDSGKDMVGKTVEDANLRDPIPVIVSGETVGNIYFIYEMITPGPASEAMFQPPPKPIEGGPERGFLNNVISSMWVAAGISIIVAIIIGLLLTRQLTKSIEMLQEGTRRIAGGDLDYRVRINSKDEIGKMGDSFNKMATSLQKAEQSRRRLNADIAHELRTPLTVIKGTVDGIRDGIFKPDREHLDSIMLQTNLLTRLTQDIRDLSLVESGQLKLEQAQTDIVNLVSRKVRQITVKALSVNIALELEIADELPGNLSVDAMRIEQAITNILDNALHYTPRGGKVKVSVSTIMEDTQHNIDKPSLLITITDNGKGIDPKHLPFIFDRFYRVNDSRARAEGGTGLGLAIAKEMVEAHNGHIWVESKSGEGCTFYIALPLENT